MATEFTVTVKSSTGDYTSWNAAMAGVVAAAANLTVATIKVFSISASSATRIAPGETLVGGTSGATGVCVLVNVAKNQILIKTIAVAAFQSGETVTGTSTNTVALSNAGDSPIIGIKCFGFVDTTAVVGVTCVTQAANYVRVYADSTAVATLPYTSSGYRLEISGGFQHVVLNQDYIRVEHLTFKSTPGGGGNNTTTIVAGAAGSAIIDSCVIRGVMNATGTAGSSGIQNVGSTANCLIIRNTIVYGFDFTNSNNNLGLISSTSGTGNTLIQNCLLYSCKIGSSSGGAVDPTFTNCIYDAAGISTPTAFGSVAAASNYNASTQASAPGANSRSSQTFTYLNSGTGDFHLASTDAGAKGFGNDLSGTFTVDFDGLTRTVPWDIGPTKAAVSSVAYPASVNTTPFLDQSDNDDSVFGMSLFSAQPGILTFNRLSRLIRELREEDTSVENVYPLLLSRPNRSGILTRQLRNHIINQFGLPDLNSEENFGLQGLSVGKDGTIPTSGSFVGLGRFGFGFGIR